MNTGQDVDDAISEHQRLIQVLRSTSREDDRHEAKKQAAELKTLRRKKVRDGLPAKSAPEPYPGVEPGDRLYIHHPERGPLAVKVHAQGRHGVTATDSEGNWHRAKWQHVLGAKQRLSQRLTMVEQGEDGAIVEDEQGQRRYIAIDPEARENQEPLRKSQPTAAQIEAGNYRKEHRRFQGLDISIENPKGSVRTGTGPGGKPWRVTMRHTYGYIRGTCGVDKDHVDCYLGPNPDASHAYVVHQRQAGQWDHYDEDKVMLGFDSAADAKAAYLAQYDDPRFFGTMTALPMADFKRKALATRQRPRMIKGQVLFFKAVHKIGNALYTKTIVVDKHGVSRTVYRLSTQREPDRTIERHEIEALYEYAKQHSLAPPQAVQLVLGDQLKAILDKGTAIKGRDGEILVQGRAIKDAHGTRSGYGMVKILWKHGEKSPKAGTPKQVTKADILRLPHLLRDIPPEIDNDAATGESRRWTWNIQRHDGEIMCYAINSFVQDQQRMHVVSIHVHE